MNNCITCENSEVKGRMCDLKCKLRDHFVKNETGMIFRGEIIQNHEIVECPDFKRSSTYGGEDKINL